MRILKYVGAKPNVSHKGVQFDPSSPDHYTYLSAAAELLESLEFDPHDDNAVHLHEILSREYDGRELVTFLESHCDNVDAIFDAGQEDTDTTLMLYKEKVKISSHLNADEKQAWLGNIDIMHDYYVQYFTNERAYRCVLNILADKVHENQIAYIAVPLGWNYGLVLNDLAKRLQDHKPPYDAMMRIEQKNGMGVAVLDMNRSKPLSI